MNDLEKARALILDKDTNLTELAIMCDIKPQTLRVYRMKPERLKKMAWETINKMAEIYKERQVSKMLNNDYRLKNVLSILKEEKRDAEQRIQRDAENYFNEEEDKKLVKQAKRDIERFDNVKWCISVPSSPSDADELGLIASEPPELVIYEDAQNELFYLYDEKTSRYMILTVDEVEAAVKESPDYQKLQKELSDGHRVFGDQFLKEYTGDDKFLKAHHDVIIANQDVFWTKVWIESPKNVYTLAPVDYLD